MAVNSSLFPSIKCEVESLGDGERCCLSLKKLVSQVGVPGLGLQSVYSGFILKEGGIEQLIVFNLRKNKKGSGFWIEVYNS